MKVQAINSVNYSNLNNVNFSGKKKNNSQNGVTDVMRSKAAAVPVIVLLAANPATLNSAIPASPVEGNRIEVSQSPKKANVDAATYTEFSSVDEAQQSGNNYGWPYLNKYKILKEAPIKTNYGNGVLLYARNYAFDNGYPRNRVSQLYIILNGELTPTGKYADGVEPIRIDELVHHKSSNSDFYGVKITLPLLDLNGNYADGYKKMEFAIDNASAMAISDLLEGKSSLTYGCDYSGEISSSETTSPQLMETRKIKF